MKVGEGLKSYCKVILTMRSLWQLIQNFYSDLHECNRHVINASYGGSFLYKTPKEAWKLFEHLSEKSHLHATSSHLICLGNWEVKGDL